MPNSRTGPASTIQGGRLVLLALIVGLAVAVRLLRGLLSTHWDGAFANVHDPDVFYHLRRLEHLVSTGGQPLLFDAAAGAPSGLSCAWPLPFDYLAYALDGLFGTGEAPDREVIAALLPVLLGAAAVLLAGLSSVSSFGLAAAGLVALMPEAVYPGAYGRFDHHALELVIVPALVFVYDWVTTPQAGLQVSRARAFWACLAGAAVSVLSVDAAWIGLAVIGVASLMTRSGPVPSPVRLAAHLGLGAGLLLATALDAGWGLQRQLGPLASLGLALLVLAPALPTLSKYGGHLPKLAGAAAYGLGLVFCLPQVAVSAREMGLWDAAPSAVGITEAQAIWNIYDPSRVLTRATLVLCAWVTAFKLRRSGIGGACLWLSAIGGLLGLLQVKYGYLLATSAAVLLPLALTRLVGRNRTVLAAILFTYCGARLIEEVVLAPTAVYPGDEAFVALARTLKGIETSPILVSPDDGAQLLYLSDRAVTGVAFWGSGAGKSFEASRAALASADGPTLDAAMAALGADTLFISPSTLQTAPPRAFIEELSTLTSTDGLLSPGTERFRWRATAAYGTQFAHHAFERATPSAFIVNAKNGRVPGSIEIVQRVRVPAIAGLPAQRLYRLRPSTSAENRHTFLSPFPQADDGHGAYALETHLSCDGDLRVVDLIPGGAPLSCD